MATVRSRAAQAPPPPPAGGTVNFGADGFFTGGLGLPAGKYACMFDVQMYQPMKQDGTPSKTPAFLAVMMTPFPIISYDAASGAVEFAEPHDPVPLGCGGSAHESFVPSANGKGFDAVPNGKAQGMWNLSNFGYFFDSLKNSGLPPGLVTNSLEPLDGIWIETMNVPEPEEKKAASKRAKQKGRTGAAAMMGAQPEEEERDRTMIVCNEILEHGKPWEGSGGLPEGVETAPAPKAAAPARGKVTPIARGKAPAAAPAPTETAVDEEAVGEAALSALATVLGEAPNGLTTVQLKTKAFAAAKKESGDEIAQVVMNDYLQSADALAALLDQLDYGIQGVMVKPKA